MILEGLRGGGGVWTPQHPSRWYATATVISVVFQIKYSQDMDLSSYKL